MRAGTRIAVAELDSNGFVYNLTAQMFSLQLEKHGLL